ncbi:hypothetical protein JCM11641_006496 [Rhodosporidiobolus odoratus]
MIFRAGLCIHLSMLGAELARDSQHKQLRLTGHDWDDAISLLVPPSQHKRWVHQLQPWLGPIEARLAAIRHVSYGDPTAAGDSAMADAEVEDYLDVFHKVLKLLDAVHILAIFM